VENKLIKPKKEIIKNWRKTVFLSEEKEIKNKSWIVDIMNCIDRLNKKEFELKELYALERELSKKHADNFHIRAKIRQQLQLLRDKRYLEFLGGGRYRLKQESVAGNK
jgi:type II restriction enzyme